MKTTSRIRKWRLKGHVLQGAVFLLIAAICALTVNFGMSAIRTAAVDPSEDGAEVVLPPVSVIEVASLDHRASFETLGEVRPQWQTTLRAQVSGEIVSISESLRPGTHVKKGAELITLEKSEYLARVAEAKSRLAAARVNLLKEEREVKEARNNWRRSGLKGSLEGDPASALVLRQPQLDIAKTEFKAAQRALDRAGKELTHTTIRAPFNGLVVARHVDLGESLFAGDETVTLYGTGKAEVAVHLDARQWSLLPARWRDQKAMLRDPSTGATWEALMVREAGHLDRNSRLRTLYLEVDEPYSQQPALLPGTFVRVSVPGRTVPQVLSIPESALTRKGYIWYVNKEDTLRCFQADPVFYRAGNVFVPPPSLNGSSWRVAVSPTTRFIAGADVQPVSLKMEN